MHYRHNTIFTLKIVFLIIVKLTILECLHLRITKFVSVTGTIYYLFNSKNVKIKSFKGKFIGLHQ